MTPYARGVRYEKICADRLRADGYVVLESRGSHGPADLAALKPGQALLIQVKAGDTELRGEWFNGLWLAASLAGAVPLIADFPQRGVMRLRQITGTHRARSQHWPLEPFSVDEIGDPA